MKDLVVLVADLDAEQAMEGLLSRPPAFGIRPIKYELYRHPDRDPGCRLRSSEFLRPLSNTFQHAIVIFDYEGCGASEDSTALEALIVDDLSKNGWGDRATVIVLCPELEIWVWSDSPQVDIVLGWQGCQPTLRQWLVSEKWMLAGQTKPPRPKEAMLAALRKARKSVSAATFKTLAQHVSFRRCTDPSFEKLKSTLQLWFGVGGPE
jgi:hypothetical protein